MMIYVKNFKYVFWVSAQWGYWQELQSTCGINDDLTSNYFKRERRPEAEPKSLRM